MLIRAQRTAGEYFTMSNHGINNDALSFKAKGLLAYLMSKPDKWEIRVSDLCKHAPDGEASIRAGLAELEKFGYLARKRENLPDGRFQWISVVSDKPLPASKRTSPDDRKLAPSSDFPQMEKPQMENHYPSINEYSNNDDSNNETTKTTSNDVDADAVAAADELLPVSKDERLLFDLLTEAQTAQGRRAPKQRFQNPTQARAFRDAVKVLNGQTEGVLRRFFISGNGGLGNAVAYLAGAARKHAPVSSDGIEILEPTTMEA